ncbi:hypothetical protein [Caulobacter sp. 17J65-9]|uniref:hypothetical protein n=1 Tax=Caulobacter sp. 17J65-9 TaxID=2709382 RepID=UPI0013CD7728|nr:hypothetical protein [Caulobacter sp. 17J65-9]NEX95310.1 hypothetical protein [Caulobacter sp. 17J65-9]
MEADRPSADVVAANVINGVMFVIGGVAIFLLGAWVCVQVVHGDPTNAMFGLISLLAGPRCIRRGLILIRRRAQREMPA